VDGPTFAQNLSLSLWVPLRHSGADWVSSPQMTQTSNPLGGSVVEPSSVEGNLLVARVADSAGNVIGLWQFAQELMEAP